MPQTSELLPDNYSPIVEKKPLSFSYYLEKTAEKVEKVWNIVKIIFNWIKRRLESFFSPLFGSRRIERKNPDSEEKKVEKVSSNFISATVKNTKNTNVKNTRKPSEKPSEIIINHQKKLKVSKNNSANPGASKSNEAPKDSFHEIKLEKKDIEILNTTIQKFNSINKILINLKINFNEIMTILTNYKKLNEIFTGITEGITSFSTENIQNFLEEKINSLKSKISIKGKKLSKKLKSIKNEISILQKVKNLIRKNLTGNIETIIENFITGKFKFFALIEAIRNKKRPKKTFSFILNHSWYESGFGFWTLIRPILIDQLVSMVDEEIKTSKKGLKELYFEGFIQSIEKNPEKQQKLRENLEPYINKMNKKFLKKKEEEKKLILLNFLKIIFSKKS